MNKVYGTSAWTWEGQWADAASKTNDWINGDQHQLKSDQIEWRIPTLDDMKYMVEGCGGATYTPDNVYSYNFGNLLTQINEKCMRK